MEALAALSERSVMGRPKRLGGGNRGTGLAIEYVRTKKVVRLLGWFADTPIEPVEIPVGELCHSLGLSPSELGAPQHFLLFAGSHHRPLGGLRDLVGTFDVEDDAWAAFRELRQAHPSSQGWAELATIDGSGHVNQLAWFGLHRTDAEGDEAAARVDPPFRRRGRTGEASPYLRAVTPS